MKSPRRRGPEERGCTRTDAVGILAGAVGMGLLALPLLANTGRMSDRAVCVNNLGTIGKAFNVWGAEHGSNQRPWWVYNYEGGSRRITGTKPGFAWFEFTYLERALPTPQVFICPSDVQRRERWASTWSTSPDRGFFASPYRNSALSYFVGLHASFDNPSSLLSGDRHLRPEFVANSCAAGVNSAAGFTVDNLDELEGGWFPELHGSWGNLLLNSGEVKSVANAEVKNVLETSSASYPTIHLLLP